MSYLPIESVYTERESILTCNNNQSGPTHCHPNTQQLPKETKNMNGPWWVSSCLPGNIVQPLTDQPGQFHDKAVKYTQHN